MLLVLQEAIRLNKFCTAALEISVCECLIEHLKNLLRNMDTSSEQDEKLLRDLDEGHGISEYVEDKKKKIAALIRMIA